MVCCTQSWQPRGDQTIYNTAICHVGFIKGIKQLLVLLNWSWVEWNFGAQSETAGWHVPKPSYSKYKHMLCRPMWHAERVPLSSAWWLKLLPSCRPEKHVDYGSQPASRRSVEGLINGDSDGGDTCRPLLNMPLHNVIWTRGSVFVEEKKKKHSLEFLKRGLRFFLWIIHCNLWNIIRSVCGCNWFVYENSHCSEKCQRQPNHRADSSGSHCSVNAASAAPPSKTKPRLKANSATTVHAGNHSSCCSHRLKAGWFSVISLQRTPELVKPLTVQLSWTIRHVS